MARKKRTPIENPTLANLRFREKRKWQIALRRYILEKAICAYYAPYFALDIENLRKWFEYQFKDGLSWENFGKEWQFDHIIPVTYFDFSIEEDLKLCWNFTNLGVETFKKNKDRGHRVDVPAAKKYFQELYDHTKYPICLKLLYKIDLIELSSPISTHEQREFILDHSEYLKMIENYSAFEFELLNSGRDISDVKKEIEFFKKNHP